MPPRQHRSIDGIATPRKSMPPAAIPQPQKLRPNQRTAQSADRRIPAATKKIFRPPTASTSGQRPFLGRFQLPLILLMGIVMGVLVQSAALGQVIILLYGLVALILHIESRTTFVLALIAIVTTVVATLSQTGTAMAQNFASYAFLLLLVGIACSAVEAREQGKLLYKNYRRKHNRY